MFLYSNFYSILFYIYKLHLAVFSEHHIFKMPCQVKNSFIFICPACMAAYSLRAACLNYIWHIIFNVINCITWMCWNGSPRFIVITIINL